MFLSVVAALAVAAPSSKDLLDDGIRRFNTFDDSGATVLLQQALATKPPGEIAAKAHLYLGLIALEAVKPDLARVEMRSALEANPMIELPAQVSPKVELFFGEVRRAMMSLDANWQSTPLAAPRPAPVGPGLMLTAPEVPSPPKPSHSHLLSLALAGGGVAAGAVAIYGGLQVSDYNSLVAHSRTGPPANGNQASAALQGAEFWAVGWIVCAVAGSLALGGSVLTW